MEAKHTHGPWHIESGGARLINTQALVISAADGLGPVAYSTGTNARLIVAAPDLLSTAIQALACMRGLQQHLGAEVCEVEANTLATAIAKATA